MNPPSDLPEFLRYVEKLARGMCEGELRWVEKQPRGPLLGYSASGWLGQFLVVIPSCELVAVRIRAPTKANYEQTDQERDGYRGFRGDVLDLGRTMGCL